MNRFFLSCYFDHVLKGVHPHGKIERKNYLVAEIVTAISSFCSLWDPKYKNEMPIKKASCTHDEQEKKIAFLFGSKAVSRSSLEISWNEISETGRPRAMGEKHEKNVD